MQSAVFPRVDFPLSFQHWYSCTNAAFTIYVFWGRWVPLTVLLVYITDCIDKIIFVVSKCVFQTQTRPVFEYMPCWREGRLECAFDIILTCSSFILGSNFSFAQSLWDTVWCLLLYWADQQVNVVGSQDQYLINKCSVSVISRFSLWKRLCYVFYPCLSQLGFYFNCI